MIKLSILIPTYNFSTGVFLILKKILSEKKFVNEIIISDNSKNKSVFNIYQRFRFKLKIKYLHNMPSTIPQKNWQYLIKLSKCDYFVVLHHDDIPVEIDFFKKIHQLINFYGRPDILSINTSINDSTILNNRIHTHAFIRKIILKYFLNYLIFRNVIGPLSSLIIKKNKFKKYHFDKRLNWLIDVKFYLQHLRSTRIVVSDLISVKSLLLNKESLTLKIKNKFFLHGKEKRIITKEKLYIYSILDFPFWCCYRIFSYTFFLLKKLFINLVIKKKS